MKLEIPIQITAADSIKRTIAGRIVSFNETANASTGKVMFKDGSLTPAPVKLNLEHDGTRPIGKSMSMDFSSDNSAIDGVFKIANTTAGSDALVEAQDGLRDGFSVEVMANEFTYDKAGTMVVSSGEIVGVALVTNPAFKSARVSDVAATEAQPETSDEPSEELPTTEGDEVSDSIVNEAPAVETVEASRNIQASGTPLAYSAPRLEFSAPKYLENKIKAALGSEDARQYVLAADNNTTDSAGLVPTRQLTEVINGLSNTIRPSIDAISRGTLPDAGMTFEIPKITVAPTVAETNQGSAFSDTNMESLFVSVPVKKFAGQQNFTVELLTRTSPLFYTELLNNMVAAMAKAQNAYVSSILVANATVDGTTLSALPTASELIQFVSRGAASVYTNTQSFARNIVMGASQWANTMSLNDAGRPIYVASQPQNAGGLVTPTSLRGNVAGLDLFADFSAPAGSDDGSMIIVNPDAYTWYEGAQYSLRAESTADGSINVGVYSFGACAIKLAGGAFRNNK
ncbi:Prohead protease [uncultured Caudovirales phage]|uniref:Prohead protease n=1 Tax=uncultured Caudovirales phage TaxID=2100421 RepID=A0A6J5R590_9CAUD|nr:Prohead protease [uncultured Caudovirales phage]